MLEVGVDEAGRGCLFGRVYAGAVIWNPEITHPLLRDSKKLTKKQRDDMYDFIFDNAIDFAVGFSTASEIDSLNILKASHLAMHRALDALTLEFDHILVDGNMFAPYNCMTHECIVGGDGKYESISAASILAKVSRDRWVCDAVTKDPTLSKYSLESNKGYCTASHILAIEEHGRSKQHRTSFKIPSEKSNNIILYQ